MQRAHISIWQGNPRATPVSHIKGVVKKLQMHERMGLKPGHRAVRVKRRGASRGKALENAKGPQNENISLSKHLYDSGKVSLEFRPYFSHSL